MTAQWEAKSGRPRTAFYRAPAALPQTIPVFPLPGALLLPRGQMPLNIFEPRYLAMVADSRAARARLLVMIQPDVSHSHDAGRPALFRARSRPCSSAPAPRPQARYILELTGVARFKV